MRIITVEEVAEMARPLIARGVKRIALIASWTAVAPDKEGKSLRQKLSETLSGFPVSGMNGFLWIAKDGSTRTTRQAFTVRQGRGPYRIALGEEVMVSLVAGWPAEDEDIFLKERNADGIMRAGAGWDILFLCPEKALQAFEAAARLSHSVAAYNAALIRLERKNIGDLDAAKELLSQAAIAGDKKAQARLQALRDKGR
jgi:TPR repeat protein